MCLLILFFTCLVQSTSSFPIELRATSYTSNGNGSFISSSIRRHRPKWYETLLHTLTNCFVSYGAWWWCQWHVLFIDSGIIFWVSVNIAVVPPKNYILGGGNKSLPDPPSQRPSLIILKELGGPGIDWGEGICCCIQRWFTLSTLQIFCIRWRPIDCCQ